MHEPDAPDDPWAAEAAREAEDQARKAEPRPALEPDEFLAWRSPRLGTANPQRLDHPLWHWLVRTRWSAYSANDIFHGPSPFGAGPMWCFDRFGQSETPLPDGRVVHIGGEHEDHYDPDFFIYNDVTVVHPDGTIAIHGYPREVFPPTDFHSATCVGDAVFVIGCLGYPAQRVVGATPVFRLALDSWHMTPVETRGDAPGWIHEHTATLSSDGASIVVSGGRLWQGDERPTVENIDSWALDLSSHTWTRLTARDWQRWTMRRTDRKAHRLWDVRQELWNQEHAHLGMESHWRHDAPPDFAALASLYRVDDEAPPPSKGPEHNIFRVQIDGVTVRFEEEPWQVGVIVEGRLPDARLAQLQQRTLAALERLEGCPWDIVT